MLIYRPQEILKVEKFADETLFISIDLTEILEPNEIAINISTITSILALENIRTKKGKFLECKIMPSIFESTANFLDYKINILVETNYGSIRSIKFICRVSR